jgi:hypothetical protein
MPLRMSSAARWTRQRKRFIENELRVIARQTPGYGPQEVEFFSGLDPVPAVIGSGSIIHRKARAV